MPSFAYTNQTNFRPFSYQEMLAPVLMATQAHQAVEEAYSELDSQANAVGSLANETNDPIAYQRYKSYEESLRQQANSLAKSGLTPGSRQSLLDLKGRYAKDITPIQNAITRRRALADEQRKALLQNPTLMFQRDMNSISYNSSLDRFLENPDYDYGERYSGALLTQQVSQAAANLAKELTKTSKGKLDDFTNTFMQVHGFSKEQVLDAISNPNRAQSQPVLNAIVEQTIGSSGMSNWADDSTMNKAYAYARQGLWSAIGQTNISTYADYGARLAAQEAAKKRAASGQQLSGLTINPSSVFSPRELSEFEKKAKANKDAYSKYFITDSDGNISLTEEGMNELRRNATPNTTIAGSGSGTARLMNAETQLQYYNTKFTPTGFRKFMESVGLDPQQTEVDNWNARGIGELWNKFLKDPISVSAGFDTNKYTVYNYPLSSTQQSVWKDRISKLVGEGLDEMTWDRKSEKFKPTGDKLSVEDFKDADVLEADFSTYGDNNRGNTVWIRTKDGETKRYRLPSGISERNENAIIDYLKWAKELEKIKEGGILDGAGLVSKEQVAQEYYKALNSMQTHAGQLGLVNNTKAQEISPYSW